MSSFDMKHPFSTFRGDPAYDGAFNGATGMIMQEDEDFEKAKTILKEYIKSYGLLQDLSHLIYILDLFHLNYDNLFPHHQKELLANYIR